MLLASEGGRVLRNSEGLFGCPFRVIFAWTIGRLSFAV